MTYDHEKFEESFIRRLKRSHKASHAVRFHIHATCLGQFVIEVPELRIRPHYSKRFDYSDAGDIRAIRVRDGRVLHIEVKWREKLDFTCCDDFRFDTVDVETVERMARAPYDADRHFICNTALTHAAIINPRKTRELWTTRMTCDYDHTTMREVWTCPKEKVEFVRLERLDLESAA